MWRTIVTDSVLKLTLLYFVAYNVLKICSFIEVEFLTWFVYYTQQCQLGWSLIKTGAFQIWRMQVMFDPKCFIVCHHRASCFTFLFCGKMYKHSWSVDSIYVKKLSNNQMNELYSFSCDFMLFHNFYNLLNFIYTLHVVTYHH